MDYLYQSLKKYGKIKRNADLSAYTSFRIGGQAEFLAVISETEKLVELLDFLKGKSIDYFILGGGTNLLLADGDCKGVFIKIQTEEVKVDGNRILTDSGVLLAKVLGIALKNNLGGMEWAAGVPGTIGGAVRGNAGAMGSCMADNVEKVEFWKDGKVKELTGKECEFEYRGSYFKKNGGVILRVSLLLKPKDKEEILKTVQEYLKHRKGRLPKTPSAGSFFKNVAVEEWKGDLKDLPPVFIERKKIPAGWLIEQAGCKGMSRGEIKISDEHSNILINVGKASQTDALELVEEIKKKVYDKFGIWLEEEVCVLGVNN